MALTGVKKTLQIDSSDRDITKYLTNGDYIVYLPCVYKNVTSIRLMGAEFPPITSSFIKTLIDGILIKSYSITPTSTSYTQNNISSQNTIGFVPGNIIGTDNIFVGIQLTSGAILGARFTQLGWQTITSIPNAEDVSSIGNTIVRPVIDSSGALFCGLYTSGNIQNGIANRLGYGSPTTSWYGTTYASYICVDAYDNVPFIFTDLNASTNHIRVNFKNISNYANEVPVYDTGTGLPLGSVTVNRYLVTNATYNGSTFPGDGNTSYYAVIRPTQLTLDSNGNFYVVDGSSIRMIYNSGTVLPTYYGGNATTTYPASGATLTGTLANGTLMYTAGASGGLPANTAYIVLNSSSGSFNIATIAAPTTPVTLTSSPIILISGTTYTWTSGATLTGALTNGKIVYTAGASGGLTANTSYIVLNSNGTTTFNVATIAAPTTPVTLTGSTQLFIQTSQTPVRGNIYTIGGAGVATTTSYNGDNGSALSALFTPTSITTDLQNNLYIADGVSNKIRMIYNQGTTLPAYYGVSTSLTWSTGTTLSGALANGTIVYTIAASGGLTANTSYIVLNGNGTTYSLALLLTPTTAVTLTSNPTVYVQTLQGTPVRGNIYTVAGAGGSTYNGDNLSAIATNFSCGNITCDKYGNLYVSDSNNNRIRIIYNTGATVQGYSNGTAVTITNITSNGTYATVTVNSNTTFTVGANVVIAGIVPAAFNGTYTVYSQISSNKFTYLTTTTGNATITSPTATPITTPTMTSGNIYTIVGNGIQGNGGDGMLGCFASLNNPGDLAVDVSNNVYITNNNNGCIKKIACTGYQPPSFTTGANILNTIYSSGTVSFQGNSSSGNNSGNTYAYSSNTDITGSFCTLSFSAPTFVGSGIAISPVITTNTGSAKYYFLTFSSDNNTLSAGGSTSVTLTSTTWTSTDTFKIVLSTSAVTYYKNGISIGTATTIAGYTSWAGGVNGSAYSGSSIQIAFYKPVTIPIGITTGNVVISGTNAQYTATNPDTNGYSIGCDIGISGYSNSGNNGIFTINAVGTTYIQVATTSQVAQTGTGTINPINSACNVNTIIYTVQSGVPSYTCPQLSSSLNTYNPNDLFKVNISSNNTVAVTQNNTVNNTSQIVNIPNTVSVYANGTISNSYNSRLMISNGFPNIPSNTYYFLTEIEGLNKSDETRVGADRSSFIDKYFGKIPAITNKYGNIEYNDKNLPENIATYSPPIGQIDRLHIRNRLHSQQDQSGYITSLIDHNMTFEIEYIDNVAKTGEN